MTTTNLYQTRYERLAREFAPKFKVTLEKLDKLVLNQPIKISEPEKATANQVALLALKVCRWEARITNGQNWLDERAKGWDFSKANTVWWQQNDEKYRQGEKQFLDLMAELKQMIELLSYIMKNHPKAQEKEFEDARFVQQNLFI